MPELDAERRERLAELLHPWLDGTPNCPYSPKSLCHNVRRSRGAADALAPLVAGWIADAWDAGYVAADHLTHRGVTHPCAAADRDNPYRAGEGA